MLWPLVIVGVLVVAAGVALFIFRRRVQGSIFAVQRNALGSVGGKVASATPQGSVGAVGIFAIIFGIIMLLIGFFYHPHR